MGPAGTMVEDSTDVADIRRNHPSGILHLFQHDLTPILVDALLDIPPGKEFDVEEFADHAGVTPDTVNEHFDLFLDVELIEEVSSTSSKRFRVADSPVVEELFELNSALNATGPVDDNIQ